MIEKIIRVTQLKQEYSFLLKAIKLELNEVIPSEVKEVFLKKNKIYLLVEDPKYISHFGEIDTFEIVIDIKNKKIEDEENVLNNEQREKLLKLIS